MAQDIDDQPVKIPQENDYIHLRNVDQKAKNPDAFINPFKAYIYFCQGNRGCLEKNEFVYSPNGIVEVKDVYNGMPILGGYIKNPYFFEDEVYEVEINKTRFIANGEHPLWAIKNFPFRHKEKNEKWITVKEIYEHYSIRPNKENKWYAQKYHSTQFKINEISVGKTFAKLLGYLMSDGYFSSEQSVKFTNVNHELLNEVVNLSMELSEEFQISLKFYEKGNGQDIMLTGKHGKNQSVLKDKLKELGVIDRTTFGKLQILNEVELIEFIKGYFNGDGNLYPVKRPVITFYTGIHKQIAYELEFMLWRLGINCLISFRERKEGYKGCWEVEVGESRSVRKLISILDDTKYPDKFELARNNLDKMKSSSNHYQTDKYEWVPITKIKKIGIKTVCGWQTTPSEEIISYGGLRTHNSGKSSFDEVIAEEHFKAGHTILDLHSAGNYESLYWCITHNCESFWQKWRAMNASKPENQREREPLHCNCNTRYKILLVVPDYVQIDQDALDNFNGKYYTKQEWRDQGHFEYGEIIIQNNGERKKIKPVRPDYIEWIKVRKLPIPNTAYKNRDLFVKELTEIMILGRDERRIITTNPVFYQKMNDKLLHLEKILREIPEIVRTNFKNETSESVAKLRGVSEPVPFGRWTVQEKNRHRVTILMREFGSLVASQLNEEKNQVIVKKAVFALVKVVRQFHISLVSDFQRANDILASVREQRDYFIWKQSNIDIVSEDYDWLRKMITDLREALALKVGEGIAQSRFPNLEDLKTNQMYVLYPKKNENGKLFKLFPVRMPYFHHRQQDDDFEVDTGIVKDTPIKKGTWRFVEKDESGQLVDSAKDRISEDKKVKEVNRDKAFEMTLILMNPTDPNKPKMKQKEVYDHLKTLQLIDNDWSYDAYKKWYQREKNKRIVS